MCDKAKGGEAARLSLMNAPPSRYGNNLYTGFDDWLADVERP